METLQLGNNYVGDASIVLLADALKRNRGLKQLYLGYNCVSHVGLASLVDALLVNPNITHLDLSGNKFFSQRSMRLLQKLIRYNTSLEEIGLENCFSPGQQAELLAQAVRNNITLKTIRTTTIRRRELARELSEDARRAMQFY
eukprot:CAMPEP_0118696306 /NCGR_PEP_ID=MMETSP0800-20121206/13761_1 /TAXON_ID=210618 ORGANISM="Striatella unipunctata, Strain CCMP2910" /NCGR_SAMPLE_ID=MMETSP0800 /ASSEMBLY_ACC=CAM_ASM_000638 /LENGTH=142 /DNA_ID=CAMNT_0006595379 /DNA_START=36 /DNA_END=464 /DNA_ORIENTATION=+